MLLKNISNSKNKKPIKILMIGLVIFIIIGLISYFSYSYFNNQKLIEQAKQSKINKEKAARVLAEAIEAKKKEPVYINLPGSTQQVRAIVEDYTLNSSMWVLVSKTSPISTEYIPTTLIIPNVSTNTDKSDDERSVRLDISDPLKSLFDTAGTYGYQLMIGSGYRSADLQAIYFNSLASSVGEEVANQSIARPGQSEHQTALAVDISTVSRECYLSTCFADTDDGKWLENNAFKFGFILRYPEGKELITGYGYEPWHFRYVGVELATAIQTSGLTFDEAWPYLQSALITLRDNGAI